jgi:hypothetical protein
VEKKETKEEQPNGEAKKPASSNDSIKKVGSAMFEDLLAPVKAESEKPKEQDEDLISLNQLPSVDPKLISSALSSNKAANANKVSNASDLFQAHNFEINIDLSVPVNSKRLQ